jgi:hypothetical protein
MQLIVTEAAAAIEHAREGAYPSREQASVNEALRQLWELLQPARVPEPRLHLVAK